MISVPATHRNRRNGFSLVEVTIAIAIVAVASVSLLTALHQSMVARSEKVVREEAVRIEPFVRAKLHQMNFDLLYEFLKESRNSKAFYAYTYRGIVTQRRANDESPVPGHGKDSAPVQGFRTHDDELLTADLEFREGEVFKIRLSAFDLESTGGSFAMPEEITDFKKSALPVYVEIFQDPTPGVKIDEWLTYRKQLSFPVLIFRK